MSKNKSISQIIWGAALVLAGVGVLFRIPQVLPKVFSIEHFAAIKGFIYFCFYFLSFALIGGGVKKIYRNYKIVKQGRSNS
ncbi:MAG: hypothetical protein PVI06_04330 [Desulfobacterales bacterium]|jgi:hypothetical protein